MFVLDCIFFTKKQINILKNFMLIKFFSDFCLISHVKVVRHQKI